MNTTIPIFPLNLVVFPDSKYPLHIFEERYKNLIKKCLLENSGFGIVATFENKISDIGVYVQITVILQSYNNGEMDIIVKGIERFFINSTSQHPDGYYLAKIKNYKDENVKVNPQLKDDLQSEFEKIIELANYKLEDAFWNNLNSAKFKSFKIAEKSGLDYTQQQKLLTLRNENERLNFLINYFITIKSKFRSAETVKKIILNDGYLN